MDGLTVVLWFRNSFPIRYWPPGGKLLPQLIPFCEIASIMFVCVCLYPTQVLYIHFRRIIESHAETKMREKASLAVKPPLDPHISADKALEFQLTEEVSL